MRISFRHRPRSRTPRQVTFCRLDELGLVVTGQRREPERSPRVPGRRTRPLVPPLRLCRDPAGHRDPAPGPRAARLAAHDTTGHDPPVPMRWLRPRVAPGHLTGGRAVGQVAAPRAAVGAGRDRGRTPHRRPVRRRLGIAWNTASGAVLAEGKRVLTDDPARFDNMLVIGVDQHVRRHTRHGDKYVTVIIDLTTIRDGTSPARLLDMADGPFQAGDDNDDHEHRSAHGRRPDQASAHHTHGVGDGDRRRSPLARNGKCPSIRWTGRRASAPPSGLEPETCRSRTGGSVCFSTPPDSARELHGCRKSDVSSIPIESE